MAQDSIKRKIAALKAKTTASGCTEAEALAAAETAARLLKEHGLSEAEIAFVTEAARFPRSAPKWQSWLLHAICEVTNTSCVRIFGDIREIEFAGREHAVEIALYLRDVLTRAVAAEIRAARGSTAYRRLRKATSKADMINSLAAGMVARLRQKLRALFAGTINAADRNLAVAVLDKKYAAMSERPSRSTRVTNDAAFAAGMRAGDAVALSHGVAGSGKPLLMISEGV